MKKDQGIYIGTDSGATTSKVGGVWADGTTISTKLLQRPTGSQNGPDAVVHNWVEAITGFLQENNCPGTRCSAWAWPFPARSNATAC